MVECDFIPGPEQALQASRYYMSIAGELLREELERMEPSQYLVGEKGKSLAVRFWNPQAADDMRVVDMYPRLCGWLSTVRDLNEPGLTPEQGAAALFDFAAERDGERTWFAELLARNGAFSQEEQLVLSAGMVGGRLVLLSSMNVIYVELEAELHGLSVADHGSYLLSGIPVPVPVYVR